MASTFNDHARVLLQAREKRNQAYRSATMKQRIEGHVQRFNTMVSHLSPSEQHQIDEEIAHMEIEQKVTEHQNAIFAIAQRTTQYQQDLQEQLQEARKQRRW